MGDLVLRVPSHIADHVHADALIEDLLQFFGKGKVLHDEAVKGEAELRERGLHLSRDSLGERDLIRCHIQERDIAACECVGDSAHDGVAQLSLKILDAIDVACAADLRIELFRIHQVVAVDAERP